MFMSWMVSWLVELGEEGDEEATYHDGEVQQIQDIGTLFGFDEGDEITDVVFTIVALEDTIRFLQSIGIFCGPRDVGDAAGMWEFRIQMLCVALVKEMKS